MNKKLNELDLLPYVDAEERVTFGSYGTIFMDDSKRLDSDIERILKRNEEDGIRTNIHAPLIGITIIIATLYTTTNTITTIRKG